MALMFFVMSLFAEDRAPATSRDLRRFAPLQHENSVLWDIRGKFEHKIRAGTLRREGTHFSLEEQSASQQNDLEHLISVSQMPQAPSHIPLPIELSTSLFP